MKRYRPELCSEDYEVYWVEMVEDPNGQWVSYKDNQEAIEGTRENLIGIMLTLEKMRGNKL